MYRKKKRNRTKKREQNEIVRKNIVCRHSAPPPNPLPAQTSQTMSVPPPNDRIANAMQERVFKANFITAYFYHDKKICNFDIYNTVTGLIVHSETVKTHRNQSVNTQISFYKLFRRIAIISPIKAVIVLSKPDFKKLFLSAKKYKTLTNKINKNTQKLILVMQCFEKIRIRIVKTNSKKRMEVFNA